MNTVKAFIKSPNIEEITALDLTVGDFKYFKSCLEKAAEKLCCEIEFLNGEVHVIANFEDQKHYQWMSLVLMNAAQIRTYMEVDGAYYVLPGEYKDQAVKSLEDVTEYLKGYGFSLIVTSPNNGNSNIYTLDNEGVMGRLVIYFDQGDDRNLMAGIIEVEELAVDDADQSVFRDKELVHFLEEILSCQFYPRELKSGYLKILELFY